MARCDYADMDFYCVLPKGHTGAHESDWIGPQPNVLAEPVEPEEK